MAPEVGLGRPYNLSADVYSWSMLLWFILALEPPYGLYTNKMIFERVFRKGARPIIFKRWREMIADIMKAGWDVDLSQRPSFLEITLCLKQELIDCDGTVAGGGSTVQGISYHGEDLNEQLNSQRESSENTVKDPMKKQAD
jgi:Protein tyrosine and serine/threonine kinase